MKYPEGGRGVAYGVARGGGKYPSKSRLRGMIWMVEDHSVNRKLGTILKGQRGGALERVEVPAHDWFLSDSRKELYRYTEGNF